MRLTRLITRRHHLVKTTPGTRNHTKRNRTIRRHTTPRKPTPGRIKQKL
ncbi:MAG TPA: hypothetical protein VGO96_21185 [Pyrinomonadaceae bacterium]|jgi:hypothetical protein|nr:hypothetical protein [Pyrinomonadaceae bacterium]